MREINRSSPEYGDQYSVHYSEADVIPKSPSMLPLEVHPVRCEITDIVSPVRPAVPSSEFEKWEPIEVTVLADSIDVPAVSLFGVIDRVEVRDSFCVVVSDDGKLEHRLVRQIDTVAFDAGQLRESIGFVASYILRRLVDDPDSLVLNGVFQALVFASLETRRTREIVSTGSAEHMNVNVYDCERASVGDRARVVIHDKKREDTATASIAELIPGRPGLVRALARLLATPGDLVCLRGLDEAVAHAASSMSSEAIFDAAQAHDRPPTARLSGGFGTLTVEGCTAALIGCNGEALRTAEITIDSISVSGVWPEGTEPVSIDETFFWSGRDWYFWHETSERRRKKM
ncbi:hypothetical protein OWR29_23040 [Actinoplanes sp. Pm04-4]|uniref:Uncharacterized protein n=1 Tax=Paractinoplanes pyxinae TaxID=2997416 RepID=A0ABT4B331_9ACTN|nr:hypothetical protein [Actinoplanes pyxinae]MCY1140885.1 hypothetical protein [Actinoplanes pyxinae]